MWEYHISTGTLLLKDSAGAMFIGTGYSGAGKTLEEGRNNVAMISVHEKGPCPIGSYTIGLPYHHDKLGPITMNLTPTESTNTFGRSAFRIHGDNARNDASHGCIILGPDIRRRIGASGDKFLTVTE